jgi:hypothetical protein
MALGKFGIKEVADVLFFPANAMKIDESSGKLVWAEKPGTTEKYKATDEKLRFTTLKVSSIEITAETTDARGGKGNAKLLTWDHSREGTLTLEDALLDLNCLQALMGDKGGMIDKANNIVKITADSFAGNYCIVGTTFAKDQETGDDHLFTFFVPNAKVGTDLNLEMSADGDPTVFNMSLTILRAGKDDNTMVALIAADDAYDAQGKSSIFVDVLPS